MVLDMAHWTKWTALVATASLLALVPVKAQEPTPAGRSVAFDAGLGYSYTRMNIPGSGYIAMIGPEGTFTGDFLSRFGFRLDFAYQRAHDVLGSGRTNDAMTYLGGPIFYVIRKRHTVLYLQGLFGGAKLSGVNRWQYGGYLTGFVNKPAWSYGVGAQRAITPSISLRLGADYLHATFFDQTAAVRSSGNLQASLTCVYSFGGGHRR